MFRKVFSIIATAAFAAFLLIPSTTQVDAAAQFDDTMNGMIIAKLPACTSTSSGSRATVTDFSGTATWGAATGAGGGSGHAGVFCDGASWKVYAGGGSGGGGGAMVAPSTTAGNATLGNYATACPAHGGSCLVAEDRFTTASLDTTLWVPYTGNSLGSSQWGRWASFSNVTLSSPYSSGTHCTGAASSTSPPYNTCNVGDPQVDDYWNPYPYGTSTNIGDGQHLLGGASNGNKLSIIASPGNSGAINTQANTAAYNSGFVWTSAAISPLHGGPMVCPATGCYIQIRMQQPDTTTGAWPEVGLYIDAPNSGGGNEIDIQEGGFGLSGNNFLVSSHYHSYSGNLNLKCAGESSPTLRAQNNGCDFVSPTDLSSGYHVYGVEYIPNQQVTIWCDGAFVGQWTNNGANTVGTAAWDMYINMDIAWGEPWRTNAPWPTTEPVGAPPNISFTMNVDDVQIYRLPGQ